MQKEPTLFPVNPVFFEYQTGYSPEGPLSLLCSHASRAQNPLSMFQGQASREPAAGTILCAVLKSWVKNPYKWVKRVIRMEQEERLLLG